MKSLPNLLIVDDNLLQLKHLEIVLKKLKVNLIKAKSGFDALEKTKGLELALAIIDVQMPKMDGYELALKMNEERSGEKVPIIFLTANHINEMQVFKGYGSGAVDYLFKSVDNQILLCKVNVFLDLFNQKQTIIRDAALLKKSAGELTRVNAALRTSEEKYRNVVERANDGICIIQDGIIKYLNRRLANMWNSTVEEVIDTPFSDYIDPGYQRELDNKYKQRIAGKNIRAYEIILIRKNGSKLHVEVNEAVVIHKGNQADMLIVRDITERKQAAENLRKKDERHNAVIENIFRFVPEGLLVFTKNLNLMKQNKAFEDILQKNAERLGYTEEELAEKIVEHLRGKILSGDTTEIHISRKDQ